VAAGGKENLAMSYYERPTIVCLCGSTRFWRVFQKAALKETLAGKIVLSIGAATGTDDDHFGNLPPEEYEAIKARLDELHLRKIDLADEVLILNVDGYIGESTGRELEYARTQNKRIRFWNDPS
jgi:peptidoglycan hydrolase-like protein with peptidoglycan-binding domain